MIAIVDYRMGNVHSVRSALEMAGADPVVVTNDPAQLHEAERIVLPGVGAFEECIRELHAADVVEALKREVMEEGKPLLGICVGLQVLARSSDEMGLHKGLGWLPMEVRRFDQIGGGLKVPHVGWNEVRAVIDTPMFYRLDDSPTFYFVHSYRPIPTDEMMTAAVAEYGGPFAAAVQRDNVFATQFHPEKSQRNGLRLLENFMGWTP